MRTALLVLLTLSLTVSGCGAAPGLVGAKARSGAVAARSVAASAALEPVRRLAADLLLLVRRDIKALEGESIDRESQVRACMQLALDLDNQSKLIRSQLTRVGRGLSPEDAQVLAAHKKDLERDLALLFTLKDAVLEVNGILQAEPWYGPSASDKDERLEQLLGQFEAVVARMQARGQVAPPAPVAPEPVSTAASPVAL